MVYGEHSGTIRVNVSYSIKHVQSCSVIEAKCWSKNTEYCLLLPGQRKELWLGKTIGIRVCRAWVGYKTGSHHVHDGIRGQEKSFIWRFFFPDGPNSVNPQPISPWRAATMIFRAVYLLKSPSVIVSTVTHRKKRNKNKIASRIFIAEGIFIPITSITSTLIQNPTLMWKFLRPYNFQLIIFIKRTKGHLLKVY